MNKKLLVCALSFSCSLHAMKETCAAPDPKQDYLSCCASRAETCARLDHTSRVETCARLDHTSCSWAEPIFAAQDPCQCNFWQTYESLLLLDLLHGPWSAQSLRWGVGMPLQSMVLYETACFYCADNIEMLPLALAPTETCCCLTSCALSCLCCKAIDSYLKKKSNHNHSH